MEKTKSFLVLLKKKKREEGSEYELKTILYIHLHFCSDVFTDDYLHSKSWNSSS